jgi:hypothetical protein
MPSLQTTIVTKLKALEHCPLREHVQLVCKTELRQPFQEQRLVQQQPILLLPSLIVNQEQLISSDLHRMFGIHLWQAEQQ